MKKVITILLLLFISALTLFLLDYFSSGTASTVNEISTENQVKLFVRECEKIAQSEWDKTLYSQSLDKLQTYRDQNIISASDALKIENLLQVSYAKSMVNTFKTWQKNDGNIPVNNLHAEMKNLLTNTDSKLILQKPYETIQIYYMALQLPQSVNILIGKEYDDIECKTAIDNIQNICNTQGISNFATILSIKDEQINKIQAFQNFAKRFNFDKNNYQKNRLDYGSYFHEYCDEKNAEIKQYAYYYDLFNSLKICDDEY